MFTDADRKIAELAATQDSIFTLVDARKLGLTDRQIRERVRFAWNSRYDGIYQAPGAPRTWRSDLRAGSIAGGDGSAISHRSAAALYELPGGRTDRVELTCPRWERTVHSGLVVHESRRLHASDIRLLDGIPVTTPERTLLDLAWLFPSPDFLERVIHAARRKRLISFDSTLEMFQRHARRGLRGVAPLRLALERWNPDDEPTASDKEALLLQMVREHGFPEPAVQFVVRDRRGRFVARTDLGWGDRKVTLEYDSMQEHLDEFQIAATEARRNRITAAGYRHFVARYHDLRTGGHELTAQLREALNWRE